MVSKQGDNLISSQNPRKPGLMNSTACSFFLDFLLLPPLFCYASCCQSCLHYCDFFLPFSHESLSFFLSLSKPPPRYIALTLLFLPLTSLTLLLPIPPHAIPTQLHADIHHVCTHRETQVLVLFSAGLFPHQHILR